MSGSPRFEPKEDAKHFITNSYLQNSFKLCSEMLLRRFCHKIPYGDYLVVTWNWWNGKKDVSISLWLFRSIILCLMIAKEKLMKITYILFNKDFSL